MTVADRTSFWNDVYGRKTAEEVSWFEEAPRVSLDVLDRTGLGPDTAIVDVGGGASRLVDALLARGLRDVTVLDVSEVALERARLRLGETADRVAWIVADVTRWAPSRAFDVWHDRAAFHFLTDEKDRMAYRETLCAALRPGGHAIIATFAPDGPETCSGLPVLRQDGAALAAFLGPDFALDDEVRHDHVTPAGAVQRFSFARLRRVP